MRSLVVAGVSLSLIAMAIPAAAAPKGKAQPTRYCARYFGGGENCGFFSMQQCRQAIAGNGGICVVAPMQDMGPKGKLAPVTPLSPRDDDDTE